MVARIAPSPIASSVANGDAAAHAAQSLGELTQRDIALGFGTEHQQVEHVAAQVPPAAPPGEAFAAAVISGQLAPRPLTAEELRHRLGAAWQPPASPLRLMDKTA